MAQIPKTFVAGDTVEWSYSHKDYRASDSWVLSYRCTHKDAAQDIDDAQVVADGSGWDITLSGVESGAFVKGDWTFVAFVTKAGERHTVGSWPVTVYRDPAELDSDDPRSFAAIALESVEAVILGVASQQQRSSTVGGMSLELRTPEELMTLRDQLLLEVAREVDRARQLRGEVSHRFVRVRR